MSEKPWDDDGTESGEYMRQAMFSFSKPELVDYAGQFVEENSLDRLDDEKLEQALENIGQMKDAAHAAELPLGEAGQMLLGLDNAEKYLRDELAEREVLAKAARALGRN